MTDDLKSWKPSHQVEYWFGFSRHVGPRGYALNGFGLMLVKYVTEAGLIRGFTGKWFLPWDFLNPLITYRQQFFEPPAPPWLAPFVFAWSLVFLWICVSMTVRRAYHAGLSPVAGLVVLIPVLNYVLMLAMCVVRVDGAPADGSLIFLPGKSATQEKSIRGMFFGVSAGTSLAVLMIVVSTLLLGSYGSVLFIGTPILVGVTSAVVANVIQPGSLARSVMAAELAIIASGLVAILVALEGLICVAMLFPFAVALGALGGMIGHFLSFHEPRKSVSLMLAMICVPSAAAIESGRSSHRLFEVRSRLLINASPHEVWKNVVEFSEIESKPAWFFRMGVATPLRASIEGNGVGAIRRCEFTTGSFIEPITIWEPHRRLAFDVASQPPPMSEFSPYRHIHPPHLDGFLRCRRGEFRITSIDTHTTLLEGSSWYELDIYPQDYWSLWSDLLIRQIHMRVLKHIKMLSESDRDR